MEVKNMPVTVQVSAQVLESLSRVLLLDRQETLYLYTLAQQTPPMYFPSYNQTINPMLQRLLDCLAFSPATIIDTRWNVIAWNNAMAKILLDFSKMNASRRNMLWNMFTNEDYKKLFAKWAFHAKGAIARFRAACGHYIDDPWITEFINELRSKSEAFDLWWPMHEEDEQEMIKVFNHPTLGQLSFEHTTYIISDNINLKMVINTPLAGTNTEEKIRQFLCPEK
ncbi:MAG: helix-turn-helix protein [Sporolactobacillus laevolacticus]|jgi:hypothetical protein|nr:helix-turn-helix protein [Sporolactobacillus laevolacticus]